MFIKQKMIVFQERTLFKYKLYDLLSNCLVELKKVHQLLNKQCQNYLITQNLFENYIVFRPVKLYFPNDNEKMTQKFIK